MSQEKINLLIHLRKILVVQEDRKEISKKDFENKMITLNSMLSPLMDIAKNQTNVQVKPMEVIAKNENIALPKKVLAAQMIKTRKKRVVKNFNPNTIVQKVLNCAQDMSVKNTEDAVDRLLLTDMDTVKRILRYQFNKLVADCKNGNGVAGKYNFDETKYKFVPK